MKILNVFNENYGTVGTRTKYRDHKGKVLRVGDLVKINTRNGFLYCYVVEAKVRNNIDIKKKQFIMCFEQYCNDKTGEVNTWGNPIILITSWKKLKVGSC